MERKTGHRMSFVDERVDAKLLVDKLFEELNDTEVLIAQRLMMGMNQAEIGRTLGISRNAVDAHVDRMGKKARRVW